MSEWERGKWIGFGRWFSRFRRRFYFRFEFMGISSGSLKHKFYVTSIKYNVLYRAGGKQSASTRLSSTPRLSQPRGELIRHNRWSTLKHSRIFFLLRRPKSPKKRGAVILIWRCRNCLPSGEWHRNPKTLTGKKTDSNKSVPSLPRPYRLGMRNKFP